MKWHKSKLALLAIPFCVVLFLIFLSKASQPQEDNESAKLADKNIFLKIKSASKAEITIEDGRYVSFLEDAVLEYIGITLTARLATIASADERARLWGGVKVLAQDWSLDAEEAEIDGAGAEVTLSSPNGNISFQLAREKLTIQADSASLLYIKDTGKPFKVKVLGKVLASLEGQATLQTESADYQFEEKLLKLGDEFTLILSPELIHPPAFVELKGAGASQVAIRGKALEAKLLERSENFLKVEFKGIKTNLESTWGKVYAPELKMLLTRGTTESQAQAQNKFTLENILLSGNEEEKVSGSFIDQLGKSYEFEASSLQGTEGATSFTLAGGVILNGEDFYFRGEEVIVEALAPALSIRVPKRFRLNLSEKLIKEIGSALGEKEESRKRRDQNSH